MNKICYMIFDNVLKRVVKGDDAEAEDDNDEDRVSITTAAGSA